MLVFPGTPDGAACGSGNLVLDGLFGARIHWAGDGTPSELAGAAEEVCRELAREGAHRT